MARPLTVMMMVLLTTLFIQDTEEESLGQVNALDGLARRRGVRENACKRERHWPTVENGPIGVSCLSWAASSLRENRASG